jgi:hypothetical protein
VGCDSNAHHTAWGSTNCNGRGEALIEFLDSSNLEILNRGNEATFSNALRQEVIDITLGSFQLLERITGWEVSSEPSLSDHRHILFTLQGSLPVTLVRDPRSTNWGSFRGALGEKLGRGPEVDMKDRAGMGLAVHWIQEALTSAYEENCPLRPARRGKKTLRWTTELETLRREVRRLFNRCRKYNNAHSWELYRETQRRYRKEVRKASKETWRTFCNSVNELPKAARLHRALSKDPAVRLESLVAPSGSQTRSEGETLDHLLTTHFPNAGVMERGVEPAAARQAIGLAGRRKGYNPSKKWNGR